ncbi:MAG TPA: twin-arginine translocation signal domain-containing protein, partial [Jatrophihabitantaceae bacterium]|nr:twin-arginine translocation signal domain-containing protein [Jatrophihabitantaceae bacterium]
MAILSRRALLSAGSAAGAAGVLGLGAEAAQAAAPPSHRTFTLLGSQLRILGPRGHAGVGDSVTIR